MSIKISDSEKERRKSLDLPLTKELRYMQRRGGKYEEIKVVDYEIVDTYRPSGTHSLEVRLETGEAVRILAPYFAEMQRPSFVEDMKRT